MKRTPIPNHLRQYIVVEARGLCCLCRINPILEIHHIVPVARGGPSSYENLVGLCANCHGIHHKNPVPNAELRRAKLAWRDECERVLAAMLRRSRTPVMDQQRLLKSFDAVADVRGFRKFRAFLGDQLKKKDLFGNFFRVTDHHIVHRIAEDGSAQVAEHQCFVPIRPMQKRELTILGAMALPARKLNFQVKARIGRRPVAVKWSIRINQPERKTVKVLFAERLAVGRPVRLDYTYQWERGWLLPDDAYTYDVWAAAERVKLRIVFASSRVVVALTTGYYDIFGRRWPRCGTVRRMKNQYEWSASRLPMATRAFVAHRTRRSQRANSFPVTD